MRYPPSFVCLPLPRHAVGWPAPAQGRGQRVRGVFQPTPSEPCEKGTGEGDGGQSPSQGGGRHGSRSPHPVAGASEEGALGTKSPVCCHRRPGTLSVYPLGPEKCPPNKYWLNSKVAGKGDRQVSFDKMCWRRQAREPRRPGKRWLRRGGGARARRPVEEAGETPGRQRV